MFDLAETPQQPTPMQQAPLPIRPEQVAEIRAAFEAAGISGQAERKALIESVVFRDVASLRELHSIETRRIVTRIKSSQASVQPQTGSAWDNREEDTWIDKL